MEYSLYATASNGKRLAAYLVDIIPIMILVLCYYHWAHGFSIFDVQLKKENPEGYATLRSAIRLHSFGFWALMCFLLEASPWQGTWGKRLMGIKVVNGMNEPLSWGQSLKRNVLKIPAYLCFGLGFLWILLNKNRSGIYDAFAHTKVVNRWE